MNFNLCLVLSVLFVLGISLVESQQVVGVPAPSVADMGNMQACISDCAKNKAGADCNQKCIGGGNSIFIATLSTSMDSAIATNTASASNQDEASSTEKQSQKTMSSNKESNKNNNSTKTGSSKNNSGNGDESSSSLQKFTATEMLLLSTIAAVFYF